MSDLLVAVVGGSVGVLIPAAVRGVTIPTDVRLDDGAIAERDEQLATWVADRHAALSAECSRERDRIGRLQVLDDTMTEAEKRAALKAHDLAQQRADRAIADARARALHEYRDEQRRASIDRAQILAREGWAHRAWRRLTGRGRPDLATPDRAQPVLEVWRKPSHMWPGAETYPDDATKRTLGGLLARRPLFEP